MNFLKRRALERLEERCMLSVTVDNPSNHVVTPGGEWDGVLLNVNPVNNNIGGSVLLPTGRHLLTAGHVARTHLGGHRVIHVDLPGTANDEVVNVINEIYHPLFAGGGNYYDIAILELEHELHPDVDRYEIYLGSDELNQVATRVGFGASGQGMIQPGLAGVKRIGTNRFEQIDGGERLRYDFDDGTVSNNTLGDLGEGTNEVLGAGGDSGSPSFINGRIAGIMTTGIRTVGVPAFGFWGGDERVSTKASWIYSTIDESGAPTVINVVIGGSSSVHADFSFDDPTNDSTDFDGSGIQLRTVPVGGADTVSIQFSEHVHNIDASSLTIEGLLTGAIPTLATGGFSYNMSTHTATWQFSTPLAADQYLITVSDTVTDVVGNALDGEWVNPFSVYTSNLLVSTFPSGNTVAGGEFKFVFTILPGDFNLNNYVDGSDFIIWQGNFGGPGKSFTQGDANGDGYTDSPNDLSAWSSNFGRNLSDLIFADFDADGVVDMDDYNILANNFNMTGASHSDGDVDRDGDVDFADFSILQNQFGTAFQWVA